MARILVLDASDFFRDYLQTVLEEEYDVVTYGSGREGLEGFRKEPVPVVFVGRYLKDMQGIEFVRELRAEFPDAKVAGMASVGSDIRGPFLSVGVDRLLNKPFLPEQLLRLVAAMAESDCQDVDGSRGADGTEVARPAR